uniref:Myb-like domain-containing protein n=1 Tax=Daucus carota subsp. sativus TaxID=79200 RepID=A0A175YDP4_DAUCS
MMKGGAWKNTEDEILKTGVMKYGKNEQNKARWNEWLDPSIVKTEWTREEDEKLLQWTKLMPSQWRTIAPNVGRTASQCLERYERLLDAACAKDGNFEAGDDPRKLHAGEFDPNAESRPARPDPVDMDQDKIEMLSEARARLANTRGKKAMRKAREKQLDEARRLAVLQKRRELKGAGISDGHKKRKRNGIDYNAEIPFEKQPPLGFYDVADERQIVEQLKFPTTVEELEGEKRCDKEARLRRQEAARNFILQRHNAPSATPQANKCNGPEADTKRAKLNLPTLQISEHELEHIAKFRLPSLSKELAEGSGATCDLLIDYVQTPCQGATSIRTPQRTPASKHDAIMIEAENQAKLKVSQTPLLGGENPELQHSDCMGVTPKKREIQASNILTPSVTSLLDLQVSIILQPIPQDNDEPEEKMEEDISDRIASEKAEDEAKMQDLHKRSEVLQRELPRPSPASLQLLKNSLLKTTVGNCSFVPPTLIEQADVMIKKELLSLLEHDILNYSNNGKVQKEKEDATRTAKENSGFLPLTDQFELDELKEADYYLMKECMEMSRESELFDKFVEEHKTRLNEMMYFTTRKGYNLSSVVGNLEKVTALQAEYENVRRWMDTNDKKVEKFEKRINLLTNGYLQRSRNLWSQIEATFKLLNNAETELKCFRALSNQEQLAALHRVSTLCGEVEKQKELEQTLQKRYGYVLSAQVRIQEEYAAKQLAL